MLIQRLKDSDGLRYAYAMMNDYLKYCDVVPYDEFRYFAQYFSKLREGEDYMVYRAIENDVTLGVCTMVLLNEFVLIESFIVPSDHRDRTNEVLENVLSVAKEFKRPIIAEVKDKKFCTKLRHLFGFEWFDQAYECIILKDDTISVYFSNLLYLNESTMDFEKTKHTLYERYYYWWKKTYYDKLLNDYKNHLML